jgi:arsenate reductase (glutaredoxin)
MHLTIYGIKNCDTMKKARAWLEKHGVEYAFHDYKTAGIERAAGVLREEGRFAQKGFAGCEARRLDGREAAAKMGLGEGAQC